MLAPKSIMLFPGDQFVRSRAAAAIFLALRRASLARSAGVADRADMRPVLRRNLKYASRASTVGVGRQRLGRTLGGHQSQQQILHRSRRPQCRLKIVIGRAEIEQALEQCTSTSRPLA